MLIKEKLAIIHGFFDSPVFFKLFVSETAEQIQSLPSNFGSLKKELKYLENLQRDIKNIDFRILRNISK